MTILAHVLRKIFMFKIFFYDNSPLSQFNPVGTSFPFVLASFFVPSHLLSFKSTQFASTLTPLFGPIFYAAKPHCPHKSLFLWNHSHSATVSFFRWGGSNVLTILCVPTTVRAEAWSMQPESKVRTYGWDIHLSVYTRKGK